MLTLTVNGLPSKLVINARQFLFYSMVFSGDVKSTDKTYYHDNPVNTSCRAALLRVLSALMSFLASILSSSVLAVGGTET